MPQTVLVFRILFDVQSMLIFECLSEKGANDSAVTKERTIIVKKVKITALLKGSPLQQIPLRLKSQVFMHFQKT